MASVSIAGATVCGDFGGGVHFVARLPRARRWKWAVCWQGESLWYPPHVVKRTETQPAAVAFARRRPSYLRRGELKAWIKRRLADEREAGERLRRRGA